MRSKHQLKKTAKGSRTWVFEPVFQSKILQKSLLARSIEESSILGRHQPKNRGKKLFWQSLALEQGSARRKYWYHCLQLYLL